MFSLLFFFFFFLMVFPFDDVQVLPSIAYGLLVAAELWRGFLIPIVPMLKVGWICCGLFFGIGCYMISDRMSTWCLVAPFFLNFRIFSLLWSWMGIGMSGRCGYEVWSDVGCYYHSPFWCSFSRPFLSYFLIWFFFMDTGATWSWRVLAEVFWGQWLFSYSKTSPCYDFSTGLPFLSFFKTSYNTYMKLL